MHTYDRMCMFCVWMCLCLCVRVCVSIRSRYLNECLDDLSPHAQQLLLPLHASHWSRRASATPATAATTAAVAGRLLSLLAAPFGQLSVSDEAADSPLAEAVKQNECTLRLPLLLLLPLRRLVLRGLGEGDEFGRHLLLAERILPLEQAQEDASPSELRQLHRKREQRRENRGKRTEKSSRRETQQRPRLVS